MSFWQSRKYFWPKSAFHLLCTHWFLSYSLFFRLSQSRTPDFSGFSNWPGFCDQPCGQQWSWQHSEMSCLLDPRSPAPQCNPQRGMCSPSRPGLWPSSSALSPSAVPTLRSSHKVKQRRLTTAYLCSCCSLCLPCPSPSQPLTLIHRSRVTSRSLTRILASIMSHLYLTHSSIIAPETHCLLHLQVYLPY